MRFPGLDLHGRVADARTIRLLRKHLTGAKAVDALFARFDAHLKERGYPAMGDRTTDASIIEAPRRRTTDAGKDALKACRLPDAWSANPAGLRRKNGDERWTLKRERGKKRPNGSAMIMMETAIPVYGYNSHRGADRRYHPHLDSDRRRPV